MCCTFSFSYLKKKNLSKINKGGTNDSRGILIKRLIGDESFDPHAKCSGGEFASQREISAKEQAY